MPWADRAYGFGQIHPRTASERTAEAQIGPGIHRRRGNQREGREADRYSQEDRSAVSIPRIPALRGDRVQGHRVRPRESGAFGGGNGRARKGVHGRRRSRLRDLRAAFSLRTFGRAEAQGGDRRRDRDAARGAHPRRANGGSGSAIAGGSARCWRGSSGTGASS